MTIAQDNAHLVATRDRNKAADAVLNHAVTEARYLISEGLPGRAEYVLARAGQRAGRILGPTHTERRPSHG
ncbi:MAG: hypothetical protein ACRDTJ_32450 [Pseudonocardiaceae bacterium]